MLRRDWIFALSGAASLIDQVVWLRWLGRQLGSDALGASLAVSVFLGGLALGAAWGAEPARRSTRPHRRYAWLSIWVALWAVASGPLLSLTGPVEGLGPKALVCAAALLPPTVAMGALFPLMGRLCVQRVAERGARTAGFYGANTLGAATGALLAPFLLLPVLGLSATLWTGAGLDALAGLAAWRWLATSTGEDEATPTPTEDSPPANADPLSLGRGLAVVAALGAGALAFEVVLFRALTALTGASVHAQGIVLAVFLLGLGGGARSATGWLSGSTPPRVVLSRCAAAAAIGGLAGVLLLEWRLGGSLFRDLHNWMPSGLNPMRLWLAHAFLAGLALLPATWAFGAALPAAIACVEPGPEGTERLIARLYGVNSLAAALGAALSGWWLIPHLGLQGALVGALGLAATASLLAHPNGSKLRVSLFAALTLAWTGGWLTPREAHDRWPVIFEEHGPVSSATVIQSPTTDERALRVNGKVVATTAPVDLRLQRLLGALPGLLAESRASALVIGLGTGTTAGSLLAFEDLEQLTVVELSTAVSRAARRFADANSNVLEDPRTQLQLDDGRSFARRSALDGRVRFDVVTADPIHPWTRGSSDLYSVEHFERLAQLLKPGGVASQWLPLYQLSAEDVRVIVASWEAAFPRTAAYCSAYDLVLLGSTQRDLGPEAVLAEPWTTGLMADLGSCGLGSPAELAGLFSGAGEDLREFTAGESPMHEDRPLLEFRAPRSFLTGYSLDALGWASRPELLESLPGPARVPASRFHGQLRQFLAELPEGQSAAAERFGSRLLAGD